jgi:anion-transporting  ArsA/GET3 family ATPase
MSTVLKYRSVIGLGELASDLTRFARQLKALIALLADPARAAFVAVTRPAALPRLETERLAHKLQELEVPLAVILANAVTERPIVACTRCNMVVRAERPELARLARLASELSRSKELVIAPATYPGPRGAATLARWRSSWTRWRS